VKRLRVFIGVIPVFLHLAVGAVIIFLSFGFLSVAARERLIRWWSKIIVRLFGLEVNISGFTALRDTGHMLVLNHISWSDIYVIDVYRATRFVAKAEIRRWPLIGWLCTRTGTIFIERGRRQAVHGAIESVASALRLGACIGVFPEGTTTDGRTLLPFHANLLQAAIDAGVPIVPATLRYCDALGGIATEAAYVDEMSLWDSVVSLLLAPRLTVELTLLDPIPTTGMTRRGLTSLAEAAIAKALGLPVAPHLRAARQ
jgi:1-acyl-sn-glycerol-3-phosphate acyltransferase